MLERLCIENAAPNSALREDTMTNAKDAGFGRRTFLQHMATAAGAAPLAPTLISAASAQTAPAHHEETNHETERLAAPAAKRRYEERAGAARQRAHGRICATRRAGGAGAGTPRVAEV